VAITSTGSDTEAPQTRITAAPSGTVASGSASFSFASSESGSSFQCSLDDTTYTTCSSPRAYSALAAGEHRFSVRAVDAAGNVDGSPASSSWTAAVTPTSAVLIADNMNRRILITDYHARVLWKFDNPTGGTSAYSGPLGVRWMANGHILATFGTGQVGEIDPVTKSFVWISSGYGSRYFKSPYDAQILPDGNLAVACARNGNGWVLVFDRATGALVWSYSINYPHLVEMIPAGKGHNTRRPTLLMAGFSQLTEAVYDPGHTGNKTVVWRWRKPHSSIHRAILDRDGHSVVVTNHDYLFKVARPRQTETWKRFQGNAVHGETRGVAMTDTGGYVLGHRVWKGASQIRFTDGQGRTRRTWTTLSDGSRLNLVWGVRTLRFPR
jgi:outer membrane protein assembly factor BamB